MVAFNRLYASQHTACGRGQRDSDHPVSPHSSRQDTMGVATLDCKTDTLLHPERFPLLTGDLRNTATHHSDHCTRGAAIHAPRLYCDGLEPVSVSQGRVVRQKG